MEATKFIKPEKLVEYYDQEIREALFVNKLNDIEFYGWLDADTVDPDYLGYAERILNPRIKFDILNLVFQGQTLPNTTENIDIEIMALGCDFIEAMKGAYLMLGQSLFFSKHEKEDFSTTYGSANLNGAIFQLGIAADRIREYYVYALTGKSFEKYIKLSKKNEGNTTNQYPQFFADALKFAPDEEVKFWQEKAKSLAVDVNEFRDTRNKITHVLASQNAKLQKGFFQNQKNNAPSIFPDDIALFPDEIPTNIDWYKKLIELGNLVFLIESKTRKRGP